MFCGSKCLHWAQCVCRRPGLLITILLSAILMPYLISKNYSDLIRYPDGPVKYSNEPKDNRPSFLVWNPKCQILARDPLDPSIRGFVRKEKFEACTQSAQLLTKIVSTSTGGLVLKIDEKLAKNYVGLSCCWAMIRRPKPTEPSDPRIDSEVSLDSCTDFQNEVDLPDEAEVVLVKCKAKKIRSRTKMGKKTVYDNVHPVLGLEKVRERLNQSKHHNGTRKLSVLVLGIDNVSRLNFERSMPKTTRHLRNSGWTELQGYNKMGDNTFPNLMAILTGMNSSRVYGTCTPTKSFGLDNCPIIWSAFRNAGHVTAYGEDAAVISTFNYMKAGFVNPPTDFYLRPYLIAAEKYLPPKRHLDSSHYCTGPEPSGLRILNYALDFARTFVGVPYFGFFWTNTMSHDNVNGLSSMDGHMLSILERLDQDGVLNDSMIIFLSDHGLRYGPMRETVQGWYEERLPFSFVWLPEWFREENPESFEALRSNGRSLTSPFNIYETLRDVLIRAGGEANRSEGCPQCQSLFSPGPEERGCEDVGVGHHWCTCTSFGTGSISGEIAFAAGRKIVKHIDSIADKYKSPNGKRICARLSLKKIIRVHEMVDSGNRTRDYNQFLCQLQVTPGNGRFEATVRHHDNGDFVIVDNDVSRIDTYRVTAKCLHVGDKQFCSCA